MEEKIYCSLIGVNCCKYLGVGKECNDDTNTSCEYKSNYIDVMKMGKLSPAQQVAYEKLSKTDPKSAYDIGVKLSTLRAMCKKGVCKDITKPGPGGIFSPRTHFKFIAT